MGECSRGQGDGNRDDSCTAESAESAEDSTRRSRVWEAPVVGGCLRWEGVYLRVRLRAVRDVEGSVFLRGQTLSRLPFARRCGSADPLQ